MIQELINFVDTLPDEVFTSNIKPKEGLYILLDIDEDGNLVNVDDDGKINDDDIGLYSKKDIELSSLMEKCLPLWLNTIPVSNAKIFNPINKVFGNTCSPFAFSFNKKNWQKYDLYNTYIESTNDLEGDKKEKAIGKLSFDDGYKKIGKELFPIKDIPFDKLKTQLNSKFHEFIRGELTIYFDKSEEYIENKLHNKWMKQFRNYLYNNIFLLTDSLDEFQKLKSTQGVYFFLKSPTIEDYKIPYQNYLSKKVFNKDDYNKIKYSTKEEYGISDSVSYFNDKKPFLKHLSAPLLYNYRVTGKQAIKIWKFFNLQRNKQIPNPMPIFIYKKELTKKAVKIFNEEKGKIGYVELIKKLLKKGDDLSNYYLIHFDARAKKSKVIDIDFVSNFRHEMNDVKIKELFFLNGHLEAKTKIKTVFDFELKIVSLIFNNILVTTYKDGSCSRRYFANFKEKKDTDAKYIKDKTIRRKNTLASIQKHRKSFYDYIFKSRRQAITKKTFDDIMLKGILDDLRLDNNGSADYSIKTKLNIWFSLYEYFDHTQFNKPLNNKTMVNKTEELINRISTIATNENEHLKNDDEFAFAAGQLIHFLLNKSEAGNRTHALLEPFLQKTDATLLKRELARCFNMYKHAIKFYPQKYEFDKIMSEVMGYIPDEKNMKNLLPSTLAGYFAKSSFYKKTEK